MTKASQLACLSYINFSISVILCKYIKQLSNRHFACKIFIILVLFIYSVLPVDLWFCWFPDSLPLASIYSACTYTYVRTRYISPYPTCPCHHEDTRMQRWQRRSRMLPAHLVFHLLVHTQTSEVSHEILSLWKAWVTYLASHGVVMMCPTHQDDDKMTDKTCYECFPQGQDLTELVSQDPCPFRISHVSECMVSSNCIHAHFLLTFYKSTWWEQNSCCQCKRMLCESVKVTVSFSYTTYPHSYHQTCHQTTRVANRRRCPSKCWCGFCARLVMRGRGRTRLLRPFFRCSLVFEFYWFVATTV
jgi:hypothetical protein